MPPKMETCQSLVDRCDAPMHALKDPQLNGLNPAIVFDMNEGMILQCSQDVKNKKRGEIHMVFWEMVVDHVKDIPVNLAVDATVGVSVKYVGRMCTDGVKKVCSRGSRCVGVASTIALPIVLSMQFYAIKKREEALKYFECTECGNACSTLYGQCISNCNKIAEVCRDRNKCVDAINAGSCNRCSDDPWKCDGMGKQCIQSCFDRLTKCNTIPNSICGAQKPPRVDPAGKLPTFHGIPSSSGEW